MDPLAVLFDEPTSRHIGAAAGVEPLSSTRPPPALRSLSDGHLGAGANSLGLRGTEGSRPPQACSVRVVGLMCHQPYRSYTVAPDAEQAGVGRNRDGGGWLSVNQRSGRDVSGTRLDGPLAPSVLRLAGLV